MPTDPVGPRRRTSGKPPEGSPSQGQTWWQKLGDTKVTPAVVLLFFLALLVLSVAAAGVGLIAHHFRTAVSQPR